MVSLGRAQLWATAALVVAGGCVHGSADDGDGHEVALAPSFPALTTSTVVAASAPLVPGATAPPAPTDTTAASPQQPAGSTPPAPTLEGRIGDATGDVTPSLEQPPPWADLVGGHLIRHPEGFELRVTLGGVAAPTGAGDDTHTMNLASFYDVDGDGRIDFEVWANLAAGGWGASYFDNGAGDARFTDESGITVAVEGADVVLRFPLAHLADAQRFRWSLASEWGRAATLGTDLAARDDAPDADAPAVFPS